MKKNKDLNKNIEPVYDNHDNEIGFIMKYKYFIKLMDKVEDLHDIYEVSKRKAKAKNTKTISLEQVKKELFGAHAKK